MAWLRIDDGFDSHPKILALGSDQRRWTWTRILVYTCRYRSAIVPANIAELVPKATPAFLRDCVEIGLVDVTEDGRYEVHDWILYNADTVEEKVIWYLERHPDATANEVQRAVGGKRELVLAAVHAVRGNHNGNQQPVPEPVPGNQQSGSQSGSRARAPVPSPTHTPTAAPSLGNPDPAAAAERLARAGWTQAQIDQAEHDIDRAQAWLTEAEHDPTCESPGALAWAKFTTTPGYPNGKRSSIAAGAQGTRSTAPPLPDREPEPEPERTPPPADFLRLAGA